MKEKAIIVELISASMKLLESRVDKLPKSERLAIAQEYREWLNGGFRVEDLLILDTRIK